MSKLVKKTDSDSIQEFSLKNYFIPLTTIKAIHWIIITGLLVYFNSLFNGFVGDDNGQILTNPAVHSITNIPILFRGSTQYLAQTQQFMGLYYKPILSSTYTIIYSLFGANAFFFHFFQLLLHITNSVLVYLILKKYFRNTTSFVLSLLFLLHPINNETVVYIANLQDVLFSFFGLLALKFLMEKKSLILISIMLLLSLLSKESGIIFFFILTYYYFLFSNQTKHKSLNFIASLAVVIFIYLFLRIVVGNIGLQTKYLYMAENATFIQRLFTIPSLVIYYLKTAFFPVTIAFAWYWVITNPTVANLGLPLLLIILVGIVLLLPLYFLRLQKPRRKEYIFFLFILIVSVAISMQIIPLDFTVADRWFYMPLFGLLGLLGICYESFLGKLLQKKSLRKGLLIILVLLFMFYIYKDVTRNTVWVNNLTLCGHDLQINPQSYLLQYCYANELYNIKEYKLAEPHALKAVELYPKYFLAWDTLGMIYYSLGDRTAAQTAFTKTVALNDFGYGSDELALVLVYKNQPEEARYITRKYLRFSPNSGQLWYAQALANYKLGDKKDAVTDARKAYILEPVPLLYKVYYRLNKNLPIDF
jgi:tetratricopeptide (TPR) repeat protein